MGARQGVAGQEAQALDTFVKLMRAAQSVSKRVHRHLAAAGLTESQFAVLEALYHLGPLFQQEIGAKILKSSANITTVVDNLEGLGLVTRTRGTEDRRLVRVDLTAAGRKVIVEVFPRHAKGIAAELSTLSETERAELGRLCKKLGKGPNGSRDGGPES